MALNRLLSHKPRQENVSFSNMTNISTGRPRFSPCSSAHADRPCLPQRALPAVEDAEVGRFVGLFFNRQRVAAQAFKAGAVAASALGFAGGEQVFAIGHPAGEFEVARRAAVGAFRAIGFQQVCRAVAFGQEKAISAYYNNPKNNLTSLSRLAVLSVLSAARRLVSLLF